MLHSLIFFQMYIGIDMAWHDKLMHDQVITSNLCAKVQQPLCKPFVLVSCTIFYLFSFCLSSPVELVVTLVRWFTPNFLLNLQNANNLIFLAVEHYTF